MRGVGGDSEEPVRIQIESDTQVCMWVCEAGGAAEFHGLGPKDQAGDSKDHPLRRAARRRDEESNDLREV